MIRIPIGPETQAWVKVNPDLQSRVDHIRDLILKAQPDADENCVGGFFDGYGSAEWKPTRLEGFPDAAWGPVEVWEHQEPVAGGLKPSGLWACWDAPSGQYIVINPGPFLSSREQAELSAVTTNGGKRTRVVEVSGAWSASTMDYAEVRAAADLAESRIEGG
jgi:hypothetical protein